MVLKCKNILLLLLFSLMATHLSATPTADELMADYYKGTLTAWKTLIDQADWKTMSNAERKELINYEYGFVPFLISRKDTAAIRYLNQFHTHIEAHKAGLQSVEYASYMGAYYAFKMMAGEGSKMASGIQTMHYSNQALKLNARHPLALTLKANMLFYAPSAMGGNKEKALTLYQQAEQLMSQSPYWSKRWNYPAVQLCIIQCYQKLGNIEQARVECQRILSIHPDFLYIRDTLLNELKKPLTTNR